MSMRSACQRRTICEVLREINDLLQDTPHQAAAFQKLSEAEAMAKKMSKKLKEYNKDYDAGWWKRNPDYENDLNRRLGTRYVTEAKTQETE